MSKILERYEEAHAAFLRGSVQDASDEQLLLYLSGLANQNNTNTGTQHRDVIRGLTINNILLKRHLDRLQQHITSLSQQNARTQLLVIALTIASLIGTTAQLWYAYRADAKGTSEAATTSGRVAPVAVPLPSAASFPTAKGASK
jgi:hypothetical protein